MDTATRLRGQSQGETSSKLTLLRLGFSEFEETGGVKVTHTYLWSYNCRNTRFFL